MEKIAIIGSGDLARLIIHHASLIHSYDIVGIFDDFADINLKINNVKVLGRLDEIVSFHKKGTFNSLIVGVGYSKMDYRANIYKRFSSEFKFVNIIHSSCIIDPTVKLGNGVFILPGCVLDSGVVIEDNVLINVGCTIAHDSTVKAHSFLGPCVNVAGFVTIGEKNYVGINTTIIDNIKTCSGVKFGAGAVIIRNIYEAGLYVGIPAKKIKDI